MTEEEITKLCAVAMGWKHLGAVGVVPAAGEYGRHMDEKYPGKLWCLSGRNDWWEDPEGHSVCRPCCGIPDPLNNDADAMALVRCLYLHIDQRPEKQISVQDPHFEHIAYGTDLRRVICDCVAKMVSASSAASNGSSQEKP